MVTKNDLILLLAEMESLGNADTTKLATRLALSKTIPLDILKFINDNRPLEVAQFYEMIRKNYNHKKSNLYKNLVKEELNEPIEALITLSSLNLQILLFAKKLEDDRLFLKHSRAEEITKVLNNYYNTYDIIPCLKLLKLIKSDLKCFEHIRG